MTRTGPHVAAARPPLDPAQAIRVAVVGLGRVFDLNIRAYEGLDDTEVVALVDPDEERLAERSAAWPGAKPFTSIEALAASGVTVDAVEALVPVAAHAGCVLELVRQGWHVNLQKPMCVELDEATAMTEAAARANVALRITDNYLFFEPLRRLRELVDDGELGDVAGYHMKMVASGRGGWDVPWDAFERQFAAGGSCSSTTGGTRSRPRSGCSARSRRCAPGWARRRWRPGSPSTRPRWSPSSTRAACAGSGT